MKFLLVLCLTLEAVFAGPIEAGYGVPLAPIQTVTIPEAPAILAAPPTIRVVAQHQPIHVPAPVFAPAPAPFIRTVAHAPIAAPTSIPVFAPAPIPAPAHIPIVASAPVAAPAPVVAVGGTTVQHHSQDEFGYFNYGYQNVNSAKEEVRTPDGITRGMYSYVDANGVLQHVEYVADPINGFRVAATNLPVAPNAPVALAVEGPSPVMDTEEVKAAKAEFQKAFEAAQAAALAAPEEPMEDAMETTTAGSDE